MKCTVGISQTGSSGCGGKCRFYMGSYYEVYSLHLPERVQRRWWKMSVLYGIILRGVPFASPRGVLAEVVENVGFMWNHNMKCTVSISQKGSSGGGGKCRFYTGS